MDPAIEGVYLRTTGFAKFKQASKVMLVFGVPIMFIWSFIDALSPLISETSLPRWNNMIIRFSLFLVCSVTQYLAAYYIENIDVYEVFLYMHVYLFILFT